MDAAYSKSHEAVKYSRVLAFRPLPINPLQNKRRLVNRLINKILLGEIRLIRFHRFAANKIECLRSSVI